MALCRRDSDPRALASALARTEDPAVLAAVVDCADRLRVSGLVLGRLLTAPGGAVLPEQAACRLAERLEALRHAAEAIDLERDRLLAVLQQRGVRSVLLKGAALRATLYAGEPVQRHVGDLDVLVAAEDVDAAITAAAEAGYATPSPGVWDTYRRHHFHVQLRHPFGYVVEVHWALSEPHRLMGLDPEHVLREAVGVPRASAPSFQMPRAEHMVLHLVQQVAQERCGCFARIVDIDRLVASAPGVDWDTLARESRRAGLDTTLALALRLARNLLGTPAPDAATRGRSDAARFHLDLLDPESRMLRADRPGRFTDDALLDLWLVDGWRRRVRSLGRLVSAQHSVDPLHRALGDLKPRSVPARWWALGKIAARQASLYLSAARPARVRIG